MHSLNSFFILPVCHVLTQGVILTYDYDTDKSCEIVYAKTTQPFETCWDIVKWTSNVPIQKMRAFQS